MLQAYQIEERALQIETADVSLIGHREENQDRVAVAAADQAVLLVVIDGMGGHAEGARAAETALATLLEAFWQTPHPIFDPLGFLHLSLGSAHEEVVKLGAGLSVEARPRATCAVCLVQDSAAYWAHVGDSRVYQLRQSQVLERTRDHSHVEVLLREGLITEAEVHGHPMRNYVECCLGGDAALPEMTISTRRRLKSGDVLLLCTDGLWANLKDQDFVRFAQSQRQTAARFARRISERRPWTRRRRTATTPVPPPCVGGPREHPTERPRPRRTARIEIRARLHPACGRLGAGGLRRNPSAVHGQHRGQRAGISARRPRKAG